MSAGQWAVALRVPIDRANPSAGYNVVVFEKSSETAARQLFADRVKLAPVLGYESVKLQQGDAVVEGWPATT